LRRCAAQHQHRRLGFDGAEVRRWLEALDLRVDEPILLNNTSTNAGSALPVYIWLAHDTRMLVDPPSVATPAAFA
jgi:hypothetical protein